MIKDNNTLHTSQENLQKEARLKGYSLLAHNATDKEYIDYTDPRIKQLTRRCLETYVFMIKLYALHGDNNPSIETIARRGYGNELQIATRTARRHVDLLVKLGLVHKTYRHMKTSVYRIDETFIRNRDYFRSKISTVAFLSLSLLLSCFTGLKAKCPTNKYKLNTSKNLVIGSENLKLTNLSLGKLFLKKEGRVMSAIPPYVMDISILKLTPAGAIELSAFEAEDVAYGIKALYKQLRQQGDKLSNPFAYLMATCKASAQARGVKPNWVLVNQMKMIAGVTDEDLRYMGVAENASLNGKAKADAYKEYVPVERVADEDPVIAAAKVVKRAVELGKFYGNPYWDYCSRAEQLMMLEEYPTYRVLARLELGEEGTIFNPIAYTPEVDELASWAESEAPSLLTKLTTYVSNGRVLDRTGGRADSAGDRWSQLHTKSSFVSLGSVVESILGKR